MKSAKKFIGILVIALVVCTLVTSLVACNKGKTRDPERDAFSMSIQNPDGVFNPFFSTSAYDSSIIALTQLGMLNTDKDGNIVVGNSEPTVALDYSVTEYDASGQAKPVGSTATTAYTDYEFVIKNGIKFSDGSDLTIKDVLFNLYVYLDPVFTGSATIYSTDIQGLADYRTQTLGANQGSQSSAEDQYTLDASDMRNNLISFVAYMGKKSVDEDLGKADPDNWSQWKSNPKTYNNEDRYGKKYNYYVDKINHIAELYHSELLKDWNAINMEDYKKWPGVDAPWKVFALTDMSDDLLMRRDDGGSGFPEDKNSVGPLLMTSDGTYRLHEVRAQKVYDRAMKGYEEFSGKSINGLSGDEKENYIRDAMIYDVFSTAFPDYTVKQQTVDGVMTDVYNVNISSLISGSFSLVVKGWATATTVLDEFIAEAKQDRLGKLSNVPNITGISVYRTNRFGQKNLNGTHDVLRIRINGVDPKAIYNFSFTVAPMKYYSSEPEIKKVTDDWTEFNKATANMLNDKDGQIEKFNDLVNHFGLPFANSDFMNNTINSRTRVGVPIGAGAYKATNQNGEEDVSKVVGTGSNGFFNNNMIYYTRNTYFWTVGCDGSESESGLQNAKIKNVVYKVVAADQIVNALTNNNIDFGDPSATAENEEMLKNKGVATKLIDTLGYGYIGVNPRYVPSVYTRRAIMMAMNVDRDMIAGYYKGGYASKIYAPMSKVNWAYPGDKALPGVEWDYASKWENNNLRSDQIKTMLVDNGFTYDANNNVMYDEKGRELKYKFTIAGGSTDHPAYNTFLNAQKILNRIGFNIQVVTSANALSDLSAGKLEVWAAAWSSTIDPDMYQIYHKDSQASATSNWGYKEIKADQGNYSYEYGIITALSNKIDEARKTTNQNTRKDLYKQCLTYVLNLAVEFPTYQRKDLTGYNSKVIDSSSLPKECTPYSGLLARIWEVRYVGQK